MERDDQIVTFRTFYDPMLAEIIKGKLEANDIPCYLADENINTIMPIYNQLTGGVKLRVFARDLENAKMIVAEDHSLETTDEQPVGAAFACPYCNSTNTRYGLATERKHNWLGIAVSFLASLTFFVGIYPFLANKVRHCFNCGRDFK